MSQSDPSSDSSAAVSPAVSPAAHDAEAHHHSPHSPLGALDRIRATPGGRLALKIGVGVLGTIVVVAGIIMIPFPGPGWAVVILGLAIWSVEFAWAKRLLHFTRKHVNAWTQWVLKQSLAMRALIGLVGFVFISAVVWASVYLSLDINLYTVIMDFLTGK
ncbi:TIGR02611 family protein [Symbioplanes lichenis]|uniref:TIGR02611 family protein n=1 Tax=Symbioplanes lichenis TaxID=1629072 RepID=UPI0034DB5D29